MPTGWVFLARVSGDRGRGVLTEEKLKAESGKLKFKNEEKRSVEKLKLGKRKADKWRRDFFSRGGAESAEGGRLDSLRVLRGSA